MIWDDYISIALTPVAMWVCLRIIYHWWPLAWGFIKGNREPITYIAGGMVIYHFGNFNDNAYWDLAWSSLIRSHPFEQHLFDYGSLSNVFFRQGAILLGGWLQVIGVMKYFEQSDQINRFYWQCAAALALGLSHVAFLIYWP